ncbi:MAG: S-methyl-5-thioribose-1-phosphate isomerase [Candidatus Thermoplasmatota archaeon]|nr:S-methyl-5-thioribose-1-phosphate isomerase [Candidatus Thermoplasmatota archaeon]
MYIKSIDKDLPALWMEEGVVHFIEQRLLPQKLEFYRTSTAASTAKAITDMVVRGAPAIGAAGAFGMAQGWLAKEDLEATAKVISSARPTAKDLFTAVEQMKKVWLDGGDVVKASQAYTREVIEKCRLIGEHGNQAIKDGMNIMTHCNAGALATVDWGTALAPMRFAHRDGKKIFVWVDETRPWLQGSRLTAWELFQEGIGHSIIADNASGHYMHKGEVDMVIVGADRVVANGDFANKIGTYEKAVVAKENDIPFYVAVPSTTFDMETKQGQDIPIEERSGAEVLEWAGVHVANPGSAARNPVFDYTPARYVTGYITEYGIVKDISKLPI